MDIFSLFSLCGGLAFFLYGMTTMSKSLEKMAGGKLEQTLKAMTSNRFKSLLLGAGITIALQSSSAMTVMLVGLVNSGIMELKQTIGVLMGSNVGTTLTAWILSLAGIKSGNVFINLLKPENFSPLAAFVGILLMMAAKQQKKRDAGSILIGFAILMTGMELMKNSVSPLADMPGFSDLLTAFTNPLLGVIVGAVFTGIIQSSAASVGILQALAMTGAITFGMAIPIVMGQNIGTCVTAVLSSIGVSQNAKQVSIIHIAFNIIGTIAGLIIFYGGNVIFHFQFLNAAADAMDIALCHTVFNVFATALLLPFCNQLEALARRVVPDEAKTEEIAFLDPVLLRTPSVAIGACRGFTDEMGRLAHKSILLSLEQFADYDAEREAELVKIENALDIYEDKLNRYLVQISQSGISTEDTHTVSLLLHTIVDFERIGDHSLNLNNSALETHDEKINFSPNATAELQVVATALKDVMYAAFGSFLTDDPQAAKTVEPLEETIDRLVMEIKTRHVGRLQRGLCTVKMGFVLNDVLADIERVSDHCSNIALAVLEKWDDSLQGHAYVAHLKDDDAFNAGLHQDLDKYRLPEAETF